jgi:hypothetical protein
MMSLENADGYLGRIRTWRRRQKLTQHMRSLVFYSNTTSLAY